jgi:hypothetical protein
LNDLLSDETIRMQPQIPTLEFVPVHQLVIHERHDAQRTLPLIRHIRASGVFRNPPVVTPLADGSGRYMVMDGANRTTALKEMGCPDALVQVVQADDPGLYLENWSHVVWELNPVRFLTTIRILPGIQLKPAHEGEFKPELRTPCDLAAIVSCKDRIYRVCSPAEDLETRAGLLNDLVDSYRMSARLDRTNVRDVDQLVEIYPMFSGLVIFPQFKIKDIMQLAGQGSLLPSGITRFTISPRALHLDYPLEELAADKPLEEKNADLRAWLKARLARKGVRYYAEATFLFDE